MEEPIRLDKEVFRSMAKHLRLDETESHLEELYAYVEKLYQHFKIAEGIDLREIEPMPSFSLPEEQKV